MAEITFKNNIRFPNLDMTRELETVAKKIIIPTIAAHIQGRKDIDGKRYAPLADSTIKQKANSPTRKSSPQHQLVGKEGRLFSASTYRKKKKNKNHITIDIKSIRKQIAQYLQIDGVKSKTFGKRRFKFFGVNEDMEKKAVELLRREVKRLTRGR